MSWFHGPNKPFKAKASEQFRSKPRGKLPELPLPRGALPDPWGGLYGVRLGVDEEQETREHPPLQHEFAVVRLDGGGRLGAWRDAVVVNGQRGASRERAEPPPRIRGPLDEPLLDAEAAAQLLSVKPSWVYDAARSGRLPHIKLGRHIRFLRSDLEDWVLARRVRSRPDRRTSQ